MWWVHPSAEWGRSPCKAWLLPMPLKNGQQLNIWSCGLSFALPSLPAAYVWLHQSQVCDEWFKRRYFFHGCGRWMKYHNHLPLLSFAVLNISSLHGSYCFTGRKFSLGICARIQGLRLALGKMRSYSLVSHWVLVVKNPEVLGFFLAARQIIDS